MPPTSTCYRISPESQPPYALHETDAISPTDLLGMVGQTVVFHVHAADRTGNTRVEQRNKRVGGQVEIAAGVFATIHKESEAGTDHARRQTGRHVRARNLLVQINEVPTPTGTSWLKKR